jgi:outer membrane protein OmpA-like peptidoglycan-associated protein
MFKVKPQIALVLLLLGNASAWADCASSYDDLLKEARAEQRTDDVFKLLNAAVAECPSYYFWQELGEEAAIRGRLNDEVNQQAALAFDNAFVLATSDTERARSVGRYAKLLFDSGDPQRAERWAYVAKDLSDEPWIRDLCEQIRERISLTLDADIKKAEMETPLMASVMETLPRPSGGKPVPAPGGKSAEGGKCGTFRIDINFMSDSVEVDKKTSGNIAKLVNHLVDPANSSKMFVFAAHTDQRGSPSHNYELSRARAHAVYKKVTDLQPNLKGRIAIMGRGADDLRTHGSSESDLRANRRLMVIWME